MYVTVFRTRCYKSTEKLEAEEVYLIENDAVLPIPLPPNTLGRHHASGCECVCSVVLYRKTPAAIFERPALLVLLLLLSSLESLRIVLKRIKLCIKRVNAATIPIPPTLLSLFKGSVLTSVTAGGLCDLLAHNKSGAVQNFLIVADETCREGGWFYGLF